MPDLATIKEFGLWPSVAAIGVILSLSIYRLVPAIDRWIDARTRRITEKSARSAELLFGAAGAHLHEELIATLTKSTVLQNFVDDRVSHRWRNTVQELVMGKFTSVHEKASNLEQVQQQHEERLGRLDVMVATLTERVATIPKATAIEVIDRLNNMGILRRVVRPAEE